MAIEQDYNKCRDKWRCWADHPERVGYIVTCSCDITQNAILRSLFPSAEIVNVGRDGWDLNNPCPFEDVDLIVACNVFHYSPEPFKWLDNVLSACKQFWMQDIFCRARGLNHELQDDGDAARFCLNLRTPYPSYLWDLGAYTSKLLDYEVYDAGSFKERKTLINFVANFKGDK